MFITNYRVFINSDGDGAIAFKQNNSESIILIQKKHLNQKLIFDNHFRTLESLKYRHYIIAKWIVRDMISSNYVFKYSKNNIFFIEKNTNSQEAKVNIMSHSSLEQLFLEFNLTYK